jgi:hypothetical protein
MPERPAANSMPNVAAEVAEVALAAEAVVVAEVAVVAALAGVAAAAAAAACLGAPAASARLAHCLFAQIRSWAWQDWIRPSCFRYLWAQAASLRRQAWTGPRIISTIGRDGLSRAILDLWHRCALLTS